MRLAKRRASSKLATAAVSVTSKMSRVGSIDEVVIWLTRSSMRDSSVSEVPDRLSSSTSSLPAAWRARASSMALRSTQRSMAWICPKRSATGRKAPGRMGLPSTSTMRMSSSERSHRPVARLRMGCSHRVKPSLSRASRMRSDHVIRARIWVGWARLESTIDSRSRPVSLASYMALSASASSSAPVASSSPLICLPPMEAVMRTVRPATCSRPSARMASSRLLPTTSPPLGGVWGQMTPNSSPPRRPTMSVSRRLADSTLATVRSRSSPARCP